LKAPSWSANFLTSPKFGAMLAGRTPSSGRSCIAEDILVGVPVHQRGTGILSSSNIADRVDPQIKEALGDHQTPADSPDGQMTVARQSVQRLRTRDSAAVE